MRMINGTIVMNLLIQAAAIFFALTGLIVCGIGFKRSPLFKGGAGLFLFYLLSVIYQTVIDIASTSIIRFFIERGISNIPLYMQFVYLPQFLLLHTGIALFIVFAIQGIRKSKG